MNWLLTLPVLLPLLTAVGAFLLRGSLRMQHGLHVAGSLGVLITAVFLLLRVQGGDILVMHVGEWRAPFGIVLVADMLSALMLLLSSLLGLAVAIYSIAAIDAPRKRFGYVPLLQVLLMGVNGAFLTGDMFNLYVWFEVMLIASFVLMVLGGEKAQLVGAVKYVTINLLASMLFLIGAGVLYGKTGTLNMADLAAMLMQNPEPTLANTTAILFFVDFGIQAAVFPFFFWATQGSTELKRLGGMLQASPLLGILFLAAALSLAGLPPFSGFFAKFALVKAGLEASQYAVVAVALGVGMLTLFSMTKMWNEVFWKEASITGGVAKMPGLGRGTMFSYITPMIFLVGITVVMGLAAEPVLQMTGRAAEQLLQPQFYIDAVLGGRP